jgi:mRNA-degrading endonuclease toxin of MazEF toxin-antitoxin module
MAQGPGVGAKPRTVLVLQHEHLFDIDTVVVAPLYEPASLSFISRVRVKTRIGRKSFVIAVDRLAALPRAQLSRPSANLERLRFELKAALDLVFSGF